MIKKLPTRIICSVVAVLAIATPIVADNLYAQFETPIKGLLVPPTVIDQGGGKEEKAAGNELAKKAVTDGIVLLKNENNALPLEKSWDISLNLLGWASVNWLHGGSGSGMVSPSKVDNFKLSGIADALEDYGIEVNHDLLDYYKTVSSPKANPDIDTLHMHRESDGHRFDLYDPKIEGNAKYQTLLEEAYDFSDTAIVVIGRQGGESEDMPEIQYKNGNVVDNSRHDLQISTEEEELLKYATTHFDKTVVIINSTNPFQMDFLETIPNIDAALLIGPTGTQGAKAIPYVLYGEDADGNEVSPSGHLADILPYDFKQNVAYEYCGYEGVSFFSNTAEYGANQSTNAGLNRRPSLPYVDYIEGIYVGYRYYETADAMGKFANKSRPLLDGNANGYDAVVQFPFGYGQSYTNFEWTVNSVSKASGSAMEADGKIDIEVSVKNTGKWTGKDVVELYLEAPYINNGIEKSAVKLVDFEKTGSIAPGKTETVTLHVNARDFASYDCYDKNNNGQATYEIDKGTYRLRLGTDSHTTAEVLFVGDSNKKDGVFEYNVASTLILDKDTHTGETVRNLFTGEDAIDGRAVDGLDVAGWDIAYISRSNMPSEPVKQTSTHDKATGRAMDEKTLGLVTFAGSGSTSQVKAQAWNEATEDEFGDPLDLDNSFAWEQGGNRKLYDSDGITLTEDGYYFAEHFDDEASWNELLGQIDYASARAFVSNAHPNTRALDAIGYPSSTSLDGPAQIGSFNAAEGQVGVGFPCGSFLAQTWNKDLLFEIGLEMGEQMNQHGEYGVYGCGMNIHRNPFGGRNYEYFSEDPFLTGSLAANYAKGVKLNGKLPVIKHLVAAETETSRDSLYTYMSEQALREIYLEPFRIVIEGEGLSVAAKDYAEKGNGYNPSVNSLMTSYNRVGAVWAGGSAALLKGVLFGEWGFQGEIITDWSDNNQYMNMDQTIRVGGNLGMSVALRFDYDTPLRARLALRDAVKNVVYARLRASLALEDYNTHPYNGKTIVSNITIPGVDWVTPVVVVFNVVCFTGAAAALYFGVLLHPGLKFGFRKKKRLGEETKLEQLPEFEEPKE